MKSDNIMINKDIHGKINIFLIDFGYSCVDIKGFKLGTNTSLFRKTKCFRESRDLNFQAYRWINYLILLPLTPHLEVYQLNDFQ
jgi:hypothetical protein